MNSLEQLFQFITQLQDGRVQFDLKCVRDAIMVALRTPSSYYEIEFFADDHIEVQSFGPSSQVQAVTLQEITDRVILEVNV